MLRNYLKIAWRNLVKNKVYSAINIGGLAVGMAVAMFIGLWVQDELSYNKSFLHYDRLGQVVMYQTFSGQRGPQDALPIALGKTLRGTFPDFKEVATTSWNEKHILTYKGRNLAKEGTSAEPQFTRMFSLRMQKGTQNGLREIRSLMLSASTAAALFGRREPIGQLVTMDSKTSLTVTGVYEDFPINSALHNVQFLTPMAHYTAENEWVRKEEADWDSNSWPCYVQLNEKADFKAVTAKIRDVVLAKRGTKGKQFSPELRLFPMSDWHLHSIFDQARGSAGQIQFVWLFGSIGGFVLLLACINFMNLNTARSEKRAKEVGIRKAVGSRRGQLIGQFLSESLLVVCIAFGLALIVSSLALPGFNELAAKAIVIPWTNGWFWLIGTAFVLGTALLAGSYPAFYLSSFQPVRVLKGVVRGAGGRFALLPRQVLVVVQFTVSITLIIGTVVVYRQIQYAKNRPVGYNRTGLINLIINTPDLRNKYNVLRNDLLATGAVANMAESRSPTTDVFSNTSEFNWPGKAPDYKPIIGRLAVTHDFGETIGFQITAGRDFSRAYRTDSSAAILNESAVMVMGLKNPIGTLVSVYDKPYQVVGVIRDMVMQSPYDPVMPTVFFVSYSEVVFITIRLNPALSAAESLPKVKAVFRKHNPNAPFDYKFVDETYGQKFRAEDRIARLVTLFAGLAILISCLGLFGLASFAAEQRTKEIGIRKVLGASVANLWVLLSKDFIMLVLISLAIATPVTWYLTSDWLQQYRYRTAIEWWGFAGAGLLAVSIALLTVSFQSIKAALMNPVKSLRSE